MAAQRTGYSGVQIALHWGIALLVVLNWLFGEGMGAALRAQLGGQPVPVSANAHVAFGLAVLVLAALRLGVRITQGAPVPPGVPGSLAVRAAGWGHAALYVMVIGVPLGGALVWFGANLLMLLAGGHAAVALWHNYVMRDGLLARMMRAR